jgi:hypothetical protein
MDMVHRGHEMKDEGAGACGLSAAEQGIWKWRKGYSRRDGSGITSFWILVILVIWCTANICG